MSSSILKMSGITKSFGATHALRDVVADAESWQRRGEEGRRRAEQRYAWDAKIEQVLRLYGHILGDRQAVEKTRVGQGVAARE